MFEIKTRQFITIFHSKCHIYNEGNLRRGKSNVGSVDEWRQRYIHFEFLYLGIFFDPHMQSTKCF